MSLPRAACGGTRRSISRGSPCATRRPQGSSRHPAPRACSPLRCGSGDPALVRRQHVPARPALGERGRDDPPPRDRGGRRLPHGQPVAHPPRGRARGHSRHRGAHHAWPGRARARCLGSVLHPLDRLRALRAQSPRPGRTGALQGPVRRHARARRADRLAWPDDAPGDRLARGDTRGLVRPLGRRACRPGRAGPGTRRPLLDRAPSRLDRTGPGRGSPALRGGGGRRADPRLQPLRLSGLSGGRRSSHSSPTRGTSMPGEPARGGCRRRSRTRWSTSSA